MAFALSERAQAAGYRLQSHDEIGSTNAEALARARAGEGGPLWIAARRQTAGRGRRGREWQTLSGNVAASVLRTLDVPARIAATLSLVAGLAVQDAVQTCAPGLRVQLKWPNDVLAADAKIAGILLESEPVPSGIAVVTGIGVNIAAAPEGLPYPATSLAALGRHVGPEQFFTALTGAWTDLERLWDAGRGLPRIRSLWLEQAAGLGQEIAVQMGDRTLRGTFETLDEDGRLVLTGKAGEKVTVSAGDVTIGPRATSQAGVA